MVLPSNVTTDQIMSWWYDCCSEGWYTGDISIGWYTDDISISWNIDDISIIRTVNELKQECTIVSFFFNLYFALLVSC